MPSRHIRRRRSPHYEIDDISPLVKLHLLSGKLTGIAPRGTLRSMWRSCKADLMAEWRCHPWTHGRSPWASEQFDAKPEVL